MSVKDTDKGWKKIMEAMEKSSMAAKRGPYVAVGVQGSDATALRDDGEGDGIRDEEGVITGAVLAGVHEFGRLDGSIPSRSFMRSTIDGMKAEIHKTQNRMFDLLLQGKLDAKRSLGLLGQKIQAAMQKSIEDGLKPDLAESTKERRRQGDGTGVFKPLLDTGQLKNSITYEVRDK